MRPGPAALLALLLFAPSASGYELHLQVDGADRPFSGPGCGAVDIRSVAIPRDATHVRPGAAGALNDSAVNSVLEGPLDFTNAQSQEDEDEIGDYAVYEYAAITGFVVKPGRAIWIANPFDEWCAGYTGDPAKAAPPRPASRQAHPERDPTYHHGWVTQRYELHVRFTLERKHIFTLDPQGTLRADPPTELAASTRHGLVVRDITGKDWGTANPFGRGVVDHNGKTLKAVVSAGYLTIGSKLRGCAEGRVYYESLAITIPKIYDRPTDYRIAKRCTGVTASGFTTIDEALDAEG
jgi:hypothetical protein